MALTPQIAVLTDEIKQTGGDQYSIPVKIAALDNDVEVFSRTINIDHKTGRTIAESFSKQEVKDDFQQALNEFKGAKAIAAMSTEIQDAANALLSSLNV